MIKRYEAMSYVDETLESRFKGEIKNGITFPEAEALFSQSLLSEEDKLYARHVLQADPANFELRGNILFLLEQANSPLARKKIMERRSANVVPLNQITEGFSSIEKDILYRHTAAIQLTDGCTVGCPECGIKALRQTTQVFEAYSLFEELQGRPVSSHVMYYASDPFDWQERGLTYANLAPALSRLRGCSAYISTAVPLGTEFTVLRYLEALIYSQQLLTEKDENLIKASEPIFRLSRSPRNASRIDAILAILRQRNLNHSLIDNTIDVYNLEGARVKKSGYLINHPARDILTDSIGIECMDGVVISPNKGVMAIAMEACTKQSAIGAREWRITPGNMMVPVLRHRDWYGAMILSSEGRILKLFQLMPPIEVYHVVKGAFVDKKLVPSVRRDALSFTLVLSPLRTLAELLNDGTFISDIVNFPQGPAQFHHQYNALKENICRRIEGCRNQYQKYPDKEAIQIAEDSIAKTKKLVEDADILVRGIPQSPLSAIVRKFFHL